jgi:murein L,D-transpeptidase YcbB/YkuD
VLLGHVPRGSGSDGSLAVRQRYNVGPADDQLYPRLDRDVRQHLIGLNAHLQRRTDRASRALSDQINRSLSSELPIPFDHRLLSQAMGTRISRALREFQAEQGLPQTGIFDQATSRALDVGNTTYGRQVPEALRN